MHAATSYRMDQKRRLNVERQHYTVVRYPGSLLWDLAMYGDAAYFNSAHITQAKTQPELEWCQSIYASP